MGLYLIKSGLCLAIVLGIYHLLLEREKMHQFNRFFLLFGLGFSFVAPLLEIAYFSGLGYDFFATDPTLIAVGQASGTIEIVTETTNLPSASPLSAINYMQLLLPIYFLISGALLVRLIRNITVILRKAYQNQQVDFKGNKLVLVKDEILPHTFWNYIFINEAAYKNDNIEAELFTHELTHAHQRHSFDILLLEILHVLFWFNPFLIPYKRAIQLNHEFLADDQVIKSHRRVRDYQELLLDKATQSKVYLASNLNFSVTKKRLTMMTKNTSRHRSLCLATAVLPLFACLLLLFSCKTNAQELEQQWTEKEIQEHKEEYLKNTTIIRKNKNGIKIYKPYVNMTDEEKAAIPAPPLPPKAPGQSKEIALAPLPNGTFLEIESNGRVLLENNSSLAPPPPPPPVPGVSPPPPPEVNNNIPPPPPPPLPAPKNWMEVVKEMAQENMATFYIDEKEITTKKALELIGEKGEGWSIQGSIDPEGYGTFYMEEISKAH